MDAYSQAVSESLTELVKDLSRDCYNSKIIVLYKVCEGYFSRWIEEVDGVERIKQPLSFNAISAIFAKAMKYNCQS